MGEAESAEAVIRGAGRNGVADAAVGADILHGVLPALLESDAEAEAGQLDVGAHDARKQDVAHVVVRRVDPAFLHQPGLHPELGGDGRNLAGGVGLDAPDGHQGVGFLGECVGDEVLELAGLVAAEGQAAVAVLALGPDLGSAQVRGEPRERADGLGPNSSG